MAYKNQKKNKAHIKELKADRKGWRYRNKMKRIARKRKDYEEYLQKIGYPRDKAVQIAKFYNT